MSSETVARGTVCGKSARTDLWGRMMSHGVTSDIMLYPALQVIALHVLPSIITTLPFLL